MRLLLLASRTGVRFPTSPFKGMSWFRLGVIGVTVDAGNLFKRKQHRKLPARCCSRLSYQPVRILRRVTSSFFLPTMIEITIQELEDNFEEYVERAHQGEQFKIIDTNVMLVGLNDQTQSTL